MTPNALDLLRRSLATAALAPSQYRRFRKEWDPNTWSKLFQSQPDHDRNAFRCYVPFGGRVLERVPPSKLLQSITDALAGVDAKVVDMFANTAVDKHGRKTTIAKLLGAKSELGKAFQQWHGRTGSEKNEDLLVCFSRHPYDVASMSTDRAWTSCVEMSNKNAGASKYISSEVKLGAVIAYLIQAEDRNITKPLARMLMRPYAARPDTAEWWSTDYNDEPLEVSCVWPTGLIYGENVPGFHEACVNWCRKNFGVQLDGAVLVQDSHDGERYDGPEKIRPGNDPRNPHGFDFDPDTAALHTQIKFFAQAVLRGEYDVDSRKAKLALFGSCEFDTLDHVRDQLMRFGVNLRGNDGAAFIDIFARGHYIDFLAMLLKVAEYHKSYSTMAASMTHIIGRENVPALVRVFKNEVYKSKKLVPKMVEALEAAAG